MGVRFIHAADLHLGSPLEAVGAESETLQQQLRNATYRALERIVDLAVGEDIDFLLLAGDLYDQKNRSVRANEFLAEQLSRLDAFDIPVYVNYGNHDPLGEATSFVELPANVHEFGHKAPEKFVYPDEGSPAARIWGQSYRTEAENRKMHEGFEPADANIPTIGMLHTGLDPDGSRYVPCSPAELSRIEEVDYWALGHIHQPTVHETEPPIIHPGIPQGRHASETGPGGCVLVELAENKAPDIEFVPTSQVIWQERRVDVSSESASEYALTTLDGIQRFIEAEQPDPDPRYDSLESRLGLAVRRPERDPAGFVVRWVLTGRGGGSDFLADSEEPLLPRIAARLRESMGSNAPFVYTDSVEDRTGPPLPSVEDLRETDRVVDEFFDLIEDIDDDPDVREQMRMSIDYEKSRNVWQLVEDPEEADDDRLALTEPRLDDLVERAQEHLLDELVRRRAE